MSGPPSTRCERLRPTVRSHWSRDLESEGRGRGLGFARLDRPAVTAPPASWGHAHPGESAAGGMPHMDC